MRGGTPTPGCSPFRPKYSGSDDGGPSHRLHREEYKPEGILDRRIWRKRNYVLADGTPFDWNECAGYFDSHLKATIKDFVKWLKNKK